MHIWPPDIFASVMGAYLIISWLGICPLGAFERIAILAPVVTTSLEGNGNMVLKHSAYMH